MSKNILFKSKQTPPVPIGSRVNYAEVVALLVFLNNYGVKAHLTQDTPLSQLKRDLQQALAVAYQKRKMWQEDIKFGEDILKRLSQEFDEEVVQGVLGEWLNQFLSWFFSTYFICVVCVFLIVKTAQAQYPDPDSPFTPYLYPQPEQLPFKPNTKIAEVCHKIIQVKEPVRVRIICNKEYPYKKGDLEQLTWFLLPPSCVAVFTYTFRDWIEVHQDRECWLIFRDASDEKEA